MNNKLLLSDKIHFEAKPDSVPYQYRLSYRIALTSLILKLTPGRSGCSLLKIHFLTNCLYSKTTMQTLINYLDQNLGTFVSFRMDPTVNNTLDFMIADKIISQQKNGLFKLTSEGKEYAQEIIDSHELLSDEIVTLKIILKSVNEKFIQKLIHI